MTPSGWAVHHVTGGSRQWWVASAVRQYLHVGHDEHTVG